MDNDIKETRTVVEDSRNRHKTALVVMGLGLAVALAGDGYLWVRGNRLNDDIAQTQSGTQTQISKLKDATTTLLEQEKQRLQEMEQQMKLEVKGVSESANVAIRRARAEAHKQGEALSGKLSEQQQQVATQLSQIQDTTNSKFTAVTTDVDGVKANVETVKTNVAAAQSDIEKTSADLKRAIGDISQRVLAQTLRRLEQDGYVSRTVYPTIPPRVDYALTPLGQSLWKCVTPLIAWAHANQKQVKTARAAYVPPPALIAL